MIQHHLASCESTTTELRALLDNSEETSLLVSTDLQVAGQGRMGKTWLGLSNALAFSFLVEANPTTPTLTSLEIGVALSEFLKNYTQCDVKLKWPNDLLNTEHEKIGGILLQNYKSNLYFCGIGLNWSDPDGELQSIKRQVGQYPAGALFKEDHLLSSKEKREIPLQMATYISKRVKELRLENFTSNWSSHCSHLNAVVEIVDNEKKTLGTFVGIGPYGEALVKDSKGATTKVYSGSLFIL